MEKRYRVNVSRTSAGKYAWGCTVEITSDASRGKLRQVVLEESNRLVAELMERYGVPIDSEQ